MMVSATCTALDCNFFWFIS